MEVEIKILVKDENILEHLDDSYVGHSKQCLLYFEDANFRFVDKSTPLKNGSLFYKDFEHEVLKKQK